MTDTPKHVTVRLRVPPELRDKIAASAEQYNRSMNADMVARLEQSFNFDESDANGKITMTEASSAILTTNLTNVITKLIDNLLDSGVEPKVILKASKLTASENKLGQSKEK